MKHFIVGENAISTAKAALILEGSPDGGWSTIYVEPHSGARWLDHLLWDRHGGPRCLARLPLPAPGDLVRIALESQDPDEIFVAALKLKEHPDVLPHLVRALERQAESTNDWERVGTVVVWSGLDQPENRSPTLGKHLSEIAADHARFIALAERGRALLAHAEAATGLRFRHAQEWPLHPPSV